MLGMRATNRGIVIVSILVLTLLATFFMGALVQMNPGRLRRNVHDENRDRASMAARAGVDYVLNRFKSDVDWAADANMQTVEMEDLVIREDHGNVLGWIRAEDGSWAGFRVRFNAQDGDDGFDKRPDPTYPIENKAISLNNLEVPDSRPVPKATSGSVSTGSTEPGDVNTVMVAPANSIALQVEGIVSPDLRPDDPAGLAQAEDVTMRTVEGIFVISQIVAGRDDAAVLCSGADAYLTVGSYEEGGLDGVLSLQSDSENIAGIRSKGKVELTRGQGSDLYTKFDPDEDAEVRTNPDHPFNTALADGTNFAGGVEDQDATFLQIEADKVMAESEGEITIPGGVYIFKDGDKDSGRTIGNSVEYYDMSWSDYRDARMKKPGAPPLNKQELPQAFKDMVQLDVADVTLTKNDGSGEQVAEKRDVITVTGDVSLLDDDGKGLTIIPERGARQKAGDDAASPDDPVPPTSNTTVAEGGLEAGVVGGIHSALLDLSAHGNPDLVNINVQSSVGTLLFNGGSFQSGNVVGFYNSLTSPGASFEIITAQDITAELQAELPYADIQYTGGKTTITINSPGPALNYSNSGSADSLHIPETDPETGEPLFPEGADQTVPQDIEIVFDPADGNDTAFIRSQSDIFLGTHLSGEGGGVISTKNVNLVGFGINIDAQTASDEQAQVSKTGVAIYGKEGINISTYDERRNNYWDVEINGAVYTEGNIQVRLGEEHESNPPWGIFSYEGAMIALGGANATSGGGIGDSGADNPNRTGDGDDNVGGSYTYTASTGRVDMTAGGIRLFYNPRYLAPYLEETSINPTFSALSVVER